MNIWRILSILYFFAAFNVVELEGKSVNSNQMVECTYPKYPTKCVCPGNCMTQYKNTSKCEVKNCYSWDENLGKCLDSGKDFTTAMILQGIPFTGAFGSGFGFIERWDIFDLYMIAVFGGIGFVCLFNCGYCCKTIACTTNDEEQGCMYCANMMFSCVYSMGITGFWIWGIVAIANKEVLDGNGCKLA